MSELLRIRDDAVDDFKNYLSAVAQEQAASDALDRAKAYTRECKAHMDDSVLQYAGACATQVKGVGNG